MSASSAREEGRQNKDKVEKSVGWVHCRGGNRGLAYVKVHYRKELLANHALGEATEICGVEAISNDLGHLSGRVEYGTYVGFDLTDMAKHGEQGVHRKSEGALWQYGRVIEGVLATDATDVYEPSHDGKGHMSYHPHKFSSSGPDYCAIRDSEMNGSFDGDTGGGTKTGKQLPHRDRMPLQAIGYRFNAEQMCRLAKGVLGRDFTTMEEAYGHLYEPFQRRPDYYALEVINPPSDAAEDEVNILFIFYCSKSWQKISFSHFRASSRARTANAWLKDHGISEVEDLKMFRKWLY
ncbi:hypothetical protein HYPSUDRAFT_1103118 [Hypholoma sublateritium FD-334 SS-4]|uniref:Uncharacterized protein n=1 Tax=Hypholoma sublateritium (strain FD-334 SS-4) TaxID=945553 RepID=A0A0D2M2X2_HYPSF|nr:hypothetical protein HYPSUDRAFT_1103118 [Hypholoma sublateritium FD-334 SS-4]